MKKEGERKNKTCGGTAFGVNVVLNICELDDTHLKQRAGKVGGSLD